MTLEISRQEEVIATLWIIAALLAFIGGYEVWGWIFAIKGASDVGCATYYGIKESLAERKIEKDV